MADMGDRGRRRRKRFGKKERPPDRAETPTSQPMTRPIILAKPPIDRERAAQSPPIDHSPKLGGDWSEERSSQTPKPLIVLKPRDRERSNEGQRTPTSPSIPSILASEPNYQIQRNPTPHTTPDAAPTQRLSAVPEMLESLKLIDEGFTWYDGALENMLDQSDFLTVGVIGNEGVGKSTILSLLAGNRHTDPDRSFVFKPQAREVREVAGHQTVGVDLYVTSERLMLLDSQAILSASILDHMVHHEKKYAAEYSSPENCLHMQSLMISTFLMTVCNVVVVVMDWFVDYHLLQFLQSSEMLKPPTPGSSHDVNSTTEESHEHFPHIVFVLNKATREDFNPNMYEDMRDVLTTVFQQSKLKYRGGVSLVGTGAIPGITSPDVQNDPNLFLIPPFPTSRRTDKKQGIMSLLLNYQGHPSLESLVHTLRNSILSVPRNQLTHATLSEKNWFHYAARTWEAIKKSTLLAEYNRLLP